MKMKKRLASLLICFLVLSMTACSTAGNIPALETTNGVETSDTETTTTTTPDEPDPNPVTAPKLTEQDFKNAINYLEKCRDEKKLSYAAFAVGNRSGEFFHWTLEGTTDETLFDMASVTKAAVIAPLFLAAQHEGLLHWDDTLDQHVNAPADKAKITLAQLLSHTSGFRNINVSTAAENPDKAIDAILARDLYFTPGSKSYYSCNNYILLGHILENTYGKSLDVLFKEKLAPALNMNNSGYKLFETTTNLAKHQSDPNRVNDEDAHFLRDVAGNAGLFSNIIDMSSFATELSKGLPTLTSPEIFEAALVGRTSDRSCGYRIIDESYTQGGSLFPTGSYGHTGHTGQSVFVDPETGLWVVLLTNATYHISSSKVEKTRGEFHTALANDLISYAVGTILLSNSNAFVDSTYIIGYDQRNHFCI